MTTPSRSMCKGVGSKKKTHPRTSLSSRTSTCSSYGKQEQSATMYQQNCVTYWTSATSTLFFFFFNWHLPMCISIIHSNPLCGTQSLYSVGWDKGKAADNAISVYLQFVTKKFIKREHARWLSSTEATATTHTHPYNVWKQLSTCSAGQLKLFEPQYMPEKPFPCSNCLADLYEAVFDKFVNIRVLKWTFNLGFSFWDQNILNIMWGTSLVHPSFVAKPPIVRSPCCQKTVLLTYIPPGTQTLNLNYCWPV